MNQRQALRPAVSYQSGPVEVNIGLGICPLKQWIHINISSIRAVFTKYYLASDSEASWFVFNVSLSTEGYPSTRIYLIFWISPGLLPSLVVLFPRVSTDQRWRGSSKCDNILINIFRRSYNRSCSISSRRGGGMALPDHLQKRTSRSFGEFCWYINTLSL